MSVAGAVQIVVWLYGPQICAGPSIILLLLLFFLLSLAFSLALLFALAFLPFGHTITLL
jgi:hypothetical protein